MNNAALPKTAIPSIGISCSIKLRMTDPRTGAQQVIDRAAAAEALKTRQPVLGDHHATLTPYYQNIPMMGRLLSNWSGSTCGVLVLRPLWHPVLVAEMLSTLASITSSRFGLQAVNRLRENNFLR